MYKQLSFSCYIQVILNAFALFWVTIPSTSPSNSVSQEEDIHLEDVTFTGPLVHCNLSPPQTPMGQKQSFSDLLSQSSTICDSHSFLSFGKDVPIASALYSSDPSTIVEGCRISISVYVTYPLEINMDAEASLFQALSRRSFQPTIEITSIFFCL